MIAVVVDLGCHSHPSHEGVSQDSIRQLISRFRPELLFGFDPHPDTHVGLWRENGCDVAVYRYAAWTRYGRIPYTADGLSSRIGEGAADVDCFDLATWLELNAPHGCILKLDVEGAEYPLLEHMLATGAAQFVSLLLVEWHEAPEWERRRDAIVKAWPSPVEPWE